ncbi:MAG TPA: hypothetical protein IAB63_02485 [Candidatus Onthocola gallistercoris]|uniref:Uncharacterized protein n=1 Tax=Candidatus Onthocola gallistercoris TaxID=2840876 RepID=A0A9D1KW78_9FIRM|nr:hypothetical protein [Candidatus Onthocola gallistercoris]
MKRNEKMLKQEKKWITDGERILFGPGQCYKICHVHRISIALQVIGALLVILTGSGVMIKDPNMGYMGSLAGFAVFLYGLHLNGIARAAGKEKGDGHAGLRFSETDFQDMDTGGFSRISLGGKRTYTVNQITVYSFLIRFMSLMVLILSGIRMLAGYQYMAVISFALAGVAFVYGRQVGKTARNAKRAALRKMAEAMESH